jgi:hypothetical protein
MNERRSMQLRSKIFMDLPAWRVPDGCLGDVFSTGTLACGKTIGPQDEAPMVIKQRPGVRDASESQTSPNAGAQSETSAAIERRPETFNRTIAASAGISS